MLTIELHCEALSNSSLQFRASGLGWQRHVLPVLAAKRPKQLEGSGGVSKQVDNP